MPTTRVGWLVVAGWTVACSGAGGAHSAREASDAGADAVPAESAEAGPAVPDAGRYDYAAEPVALDADLVVAEGETLRVGPGVTFTAAAGVKIQIAGHLIATGTGEAPVRFLGAGTPRSWHGIVVERGGRLELTHVAIGGATYGIHALAGSDFAVDHADIGTSFKAAVIASDGTFAHTRFHASGDTLFSAVSEDRIEDINGTLTIVGASPTVSHSHFDNSNVLVDMIVVDGDSAPVFDHVHIVDAHCGFHMFAGTVRVTDSVFERLVFGIMAYATAPVIEDSVFRGNLTDVGLCLGATPELAPSLRNNFYASGAVLLDASCVQVETEDESPAAEPNEGAGPDST